MIVFLYCSCLWPIHWSQVLSWVWKYSWSNANRGCFNYIWVINNFIANSDATDIRCLTVHTFKVTLYQMLRNEEMHKESQNHTERISMNKHAIMCQNGPELDPCWQHGSNSGPVLAHYVLGLLVFESLFGIGSPASGDNDNRWHVFLITGCWALLPWQPQNAI